MFVMSTIFRIPTFYRNYTNFGQYKRTLRFFLFSLPKLQINISFRVDVSCEK